MDIKKKLVMLCTHEPNLDPRVKWEYTSASKFFDVTVLGMIDTRTPNLENSPLESVNIKRLNFEEYDTIEITKNLLISLSRFSFILPLLFVLFIICSLILIPIFLIYFQIPIFRRMHQRVAAISEVKNKLRFSADWLAAKEILRIPIKIIAKSYIWKKIGQLLFEYQPVNTFSNSTRDFIWLINHIMRVNTALSNELNNSKNIFQIIHCNDLDSLIAGILYKAKTGAKLIYDSHEFWPSSLTGAPKFHILFFGCLEYILIRVPDYVITVNPLLANEMQKIYGILNIKSIINAEPWIANRKSLKNENIINVAKNRIKFIYMGNFALRRGLEELITAWEELSPKNSVLFLQGPKNFHRDELVLRCEKLKTFNCSVFFTDPVSEDELVSSAMQFDIGVIPYKPINIGYKFCCPNKLSQYLQAGLAIVANNLEFVKSIVDAHEVGIIYDDNNIDSIKDAISRIELDRASLDKFKYNAKKLAEHSFNWQSQEVTLLEAYG